MQVYKAFFKIIQKNILQILIYIVIFLFFVVLMANTYTDPTNMDFKESKVNTVFINHDEDSKLLEGLKEYISHNANLIDIPDDIQKLQDALYFREVEYIVKVPKGFTEAFMKGEEIRIEKTIVPDSASSVYMDNLINKYLNTARLYISSIENLSQQQLVNYIGEDLSHETEVLLFNPDPEKGKNIRRMYYFNFLAYSLFAILILGVSAVMIVFNQPDLRKRHSCSPLKLKNMNFQMILGNISFAILVWLIMIIPSFIMYGDYMFTKKGLLFLLNSIIFTLPALSISFLIANIVKSKNAISAASNVVSLGTCFISGVFVPRDFLGETLLKFASFTPTYWYVKSNHIIANIDRLKEEDIRSILTSILIMLIFALTALVITMVIKKQKYTGQVSGS